MCEFKICHFVFCVNMERLCNRLASRWSCISIVCDNTRKYKQNKINIVAINTWDRQRWIYIRNFVSLNAQFHFESKQARKRYKLTSKTNSIDQLRPGISIFRITRAMFSIRQCRKKCEQKTLLFVRWQQWNIEHHKRKKAQKTAIEFNETKEIVMWSFIFM